MNINNVEVCYLFTESLLSGAYGDGVACGGDGGVANGDGIVLPHYFVTACMILSSMGI